MCIHTHLLALLSRACTRAGNFQRTLSAIGPYEFRGNSYGPIIGPYLFQGKFVWTNGPESSSKVFPLHWYWSMDGSSQNLGIVFGERQTGGNKTIYLHRSGPLLENGLDRPENRYGRYGFASFFQNFHIYRRGGWSQTSPLKIFFFCCLGGGGRYFSAPCQSIAQKGVRAVDARNSQLENGPNAAKKPVFALPGSQRMSVNTLLCDTFALADSL